MTTYHGKITISNCSFRYNSAPTNRPGSIFSTNLDNVNLQKSFVLSGTNIISGDNPNSIHHTIIITNTMASGSLIDISTTTMNCSRGQNMVKKSVNVRYLKIDCVSCDGSKYNAMDSSSMHWDEQSRPVEDPHNVTCYTCPYQASCVAQIKGKGNFWGFSNSSGHVNMYLCPPEYCCISASKCGSYNTCNQHRKGTLCSDCLEGYVLSIFSRSQCIHPMDCNSEWLFWVGFAVSVISICVFLLYGSEIWKLLKSLFTSSRESHENQSAEFSGDEHEESSETSSLNQYFLLQEENVRTSSANSSSQLSGLVKIIFFFYQTASIVRIIASAKDVYQMPQMVGIVLSLFNIRIDREQETKHMSP